MDLSKVAVAIRPRNAWEGIDLGFAMGRRWFSRLWALWWLAALPTAALGLALFDSLVGALLLVWWLKPAYEPPLLYWASRAVFGDRLGIRQTFGHWRRFLNRQTLANITYRRLAPSRSFFMSVSVLEGLNGKPRAARVRVLGRGQQAGGWLTFIGMHFEWVLQFGLALLVLILVPEQVQWADLEGFLLTEGTAEEWFWAAAIMTGSSLIAPFYVAGGFALYLSRRIELEAWDLELSFRRMAERHAQGVAVRGRAALLGALVFGLGFGPPEPAFAVAITPGQARERVAEVLAVDAFGEMQEHAEWRYIGDGIELDLEPDGAPGWLEALFRFLSALPEVARLALWVGAGVLLAWLAVWVYRNRRWIFAARMRRGAAQRQTPSELFGLDLRGESLPRDPMAEALRLLAAGDSRGALSLLYRGALVRLVFDHGLEIPRSATEGECLRRVDARCTPELSAYFGELTRHWRSLAYAHRIPERSRLERLAQGWGAAFGGPGESA